MRFHYASINATTYALYSLLARQRGNWVSWAEAKDVMEHAARTADRDRLADYVAKTGSIELGMAELVKQTIRSVARQSDRHPGRVEVETVTRPTKGGGIQTRRTRVRFRDRALAKVWFEPVNPQRAPLSKVKPGTTPRPSRYGERTLAGWREKEAFAQAPLRDIDQVFWMEHTDLDHDLLAQYLPHGARIKPPQGPAQQIWAPYGAGPAVRRALEHVAAIQSPPAVIKNVSGRVLSRRDLSELPAGFLDALAAHYVPQLSGRMVNKRRGVFEAHKLDRGDIDGLSGLFLMEIAERYNHHEGDFGPYANDQALHMADDVARYGSSGRHAATKEIKIAKAERKLAVDGEHVPDAELAAELKISVAEVVAWRRAVASSRAIRTPHSMDATLSEDDNQTVGHRIADESADPTRHLEAWEERHRATAKLLDAIRPSDPYRPNGRATGHDHGQTLPNVVGLLAFVHTAHGTGTAQGLAEQLQVNSSLVNTAIRRVRDRITSSGIPADWWASQHRATQELIAACKPRDAAARLHTRSVDAVAAHGIAVPNLVRLWAQQQRVMKHRSDTDLARDLGIDRRTITHLAAHH